MNVELEIEGTKFKFIQGDRILVYHYKKCVGCGICVYACPVNAIELQPVHDIALGLDMPPIMIDHTKCTLCGICFTFCMFNAFELIISTRKLRKDEMPVYIGGYIKKLDCVNCTICHYVCPSDAIDRIVKFRRSDIKIRNEGVIGKVEIDKEKCTRCGLCVDFCEAFKPVKNDRLKPYQDIIFDENFCDYCKLCEDICPSNAIKVNGKRVIENKIDRIAEVKVNVEKCIFCGRCVKACPYDNIEFVKPIEGRIVLRDQFYEKCDPIGCKACLLICPTKAWYMENGRLKVDEDVCIYCGACENACSYKLITVRRESIKVVIRNTPYTEGWMRAVNRILMRVIGNEDGKDVIFIPV